VQGATSAGQEKKLRPVSFELLEHWQHLATPACTHRPEILMHLGTAYEQASPGGSFSASYVLTEDIHPEVVVQVEALQLANAVCRHQARGRISLSMSNEAGNDSTRWKEDCGA